MFSFRAAVRFRAVLLPMLLMVLSLAPVRQAQAITVFMTQPQPGDSSVSVSWFWNGFPPPSYFVVYYGTGGQTNRSTERISFGTFKKIDSLTNNASYTFIVRAYSDSDELLAESNRVSATPNGSGGGGGGGGNPGTGPDKIGGRITSGGVGLAGVRLSCVHGRPNNGGDYQDISPTTDANGYYSFSPSHDGDYKITPQPGDYTFEPSNQTASKGQNAVNFTASRKYTVYVVVRTAADRPVPNIAFIVLRNNSQVSNSSTGTTDSDGRCAVSWSSSESGPFQILPNNTNYTFDPVSRGVSSSNTPSDPLIFIATKIVPRFKVGGSVRLVHSILSDTEQISLTISGNPDDADAGTFKDQTVQTQGTGDSRTFLFSGVPAGSYYVTPSAQKATLPQPLFQLVRVRADDLGLFFLFDFGAPPIVRIFSPPESDGPPGKVLNFGESLRELKGSAVAGDGRTVAQLQVFLVRSPKNSTDLDNDDFWCLANSGDTRPSWVNRKDSRAKAILLLNSQPQTVNWGVPSNQLPAGSDLDTQHIYRASAIAQDDVGRFPLPNSPRHDSWTRAYFTVANNYTLTLDSDKTAMCAGGINSPVHRALLTATYKDQDGRTLPGTKVVFSWDTPGPSAAVNKTVTMNARGEAYANVISGDEVGSVTVTATVTTGSVVKTMQKTISIKAADGVMDINPKEGVVADGTSPITLTLPLRFATRPVAGHKILWRVARMEDEQGKLVTPNRFGDYPGYGSFEKPQPATAIITDANGNARIKYIVGTKPGTVYFEALDLSVFEGAGSSVQAVKSALEASAAPAARRNKPYAGSSKPSGQTFSISGQVKTRDEKGVPNISIGRRLPKSDIKDSVLTMTDAKGNYTLKNVPPGDWVVTTVIEKSDPRDRTVSVVDKDRTGQNFFIAQPGQELLHPQLSQSASDALRKAGITDLARIVKVIDRKKSKASGKTHLYSGVENKVRYGNAIDISVASTPAQRLTDVRNLRLQGFAAWYRVGVGSGLHYHIVWAGSKSRNDDNRRQISSFVQGLIGVKTEVSETDSPIKQDEIDAVKAKYESVYGKGSLDGIGTYGAIPKKKK